MLTKNQVIEVAMKLFVHFGVEKTSLHDVARTLQVSIPSLYRHFENKGELMMAVIKRTADIEGLLIKSRCRSGKQFPAFLSSLVCVKYLNFQKNNRLFHSIEYFKSIGYWDRIMELRIFYSDEIVRECCNSVVIRNKKKAKIFKDKLRDFLMEIDTIHLENATRKTAIGATDKNTMKEIFNLVRSRTDQFLFEISNRKIIV